MSEKKKKIEFLIENYRKRIKGGPLLFENQLDRKSLTAYKEDLDPEGKRFEGKPQSKVASSFFGLPSIKFGKLIGRKPFNFDMGAKYMPDYNPNYEFGKKRLSNGVIDFKKSTGRKTKEVSSATPSFFSNELFITRENVQKPKVKTFLFAKYLNRNVDENSPLPSFMQVVSWFSSLIWSSNILKADQRQHKNID